MGYYKQENETRPKNKVSADFSDWVSGNILKIYLRKSFEMMMLGNTVGRIRKMMCRRRMVWTQDRNPEVDRHRWGLLGIWLVDRQGGNAVSPGWLWELPPGSLEMRWSPGTRIEHCGQAGKAQSTSTEEQGAWRKLDIDCKHGLLEAEEKGDLAW